MKIAIKLLLVLLIITIITSSSYGCKKSIFKRHAIGKVTDITDGTPIPFAQIAIQNEQTEFLGKTTYDMLATGQCDANGEFELSYITDRAGTNFVYAQAEHYFMNPTTDKDQVNSNTRKKLSVKLTPKTQVDVNFNITDTTLIGINFAFDYEAHSSTTFNAPIGVSHTTFEVKGNSENTFGYSIYYKIGGYKQIKDKVFCPKWNLPKAVININL